MRSLKRNNRKSSSNEVVRLETKETTREQDSDRNMMEDSKEGNATLSNPYYFMQWNYRRTVIMKKFTLTFSGNNLSEQKEEGRKQQSSELDEASREEGIYK